MSSSQMTNSADLETFSSMSAAAWDSMTLEDIDEFCITLDRYSKGELQVFLKESLIRFKRIKEENEVNQGKIRGYQTLGKLLKDAKDKLKKQRRYIEKLEKEHSDDKNNIVKLNENPKIDTSERTHGGDGIELKTDRNEEDHGKIGELNVIEEKEVARKAKHWAAVATGLDPEMTYSFTSLDPAVYIGSAPCQHEPITQEPKLSSEIVLHTSQMKLDIKPDELRKMKKSTYRAESENEKMMLEEINKMETQIQILYMDIWAAEKEAETSKSDLRRLMNDTKIQLDAANKKVDQEHKKVLDLEACIEETILKLEEERQSKTVIENALREVEQNMKSCDIERPPVETRTPNDIAATYHERQSHEFNLSLKKIEVMARDELIDTMKLLKYQIESLSNDFKLEKESKEKFMAENDIMSSDLSRAMSTIEQYKYQILEHRKKNLELNQSVERLRGDIKRKYEECRRLQGLTYTYLGSSDGKSWDCIACTFVNKIKDLRCEVCDFPRWQSGIKMEDIGYEIKNLEL